MAAGQWRQGAAAGRVEKEHIKMVLGLLHQCGHVLGLSPYTDCPSCGLLRSGTSMQVGWMMGPNAQGIRGALATHSYQPGDIISIVPRNCTFDLGPQDWTAPVSWTLL